MILHLVENSWYDNGTKRTFSFDTSGMFVDKYGKTPQIGFNNDYKFGDWLHSYVQQRLITEGLLVKMVGKCTPIFYSPKAFDSPKKLLLLICGSGRILAGLWSVGVCAYRGLDAGSVLPCLTEAKKRDMEVIIFNPNHPNSSSNHTSEIFRQLIVPSNPDRVWILAHSMGGDSTCNIIAENPQFCIQHVEAFALTDGCEKRVRAEGFRIGKWCLLKGVNWVRSEAEVNKTLGEGDATIHRSAQTSDHPLTTFMAFRYIWEFFDENGANDVKSPQLPENFIGVE